MTENVGQRPIPNHLIPASSSKNSYDKTNYVSMNPGQFLSNSSFNGFVENEEEEELLSQKVLPLIPFDPTHNVSACGSSHPCHDYEAIDPISQRLREMSESIKNTYGGDDHLNKSPAHIVLEPPINQVCNSEDKTYNSKLQCDAMQDFNLSSINDAQFGSLTPVCSKAYTSINLNDSDDIEVHEKAVCSTTCDIVGNQKTIDTQSDNDQSQCGVKCKDTETSKNGHLPGENIGSSVTIPRIQKSQQSHVRKSMRINNGITSTSLSRSYQHSSSQSPDKTNGVSDFERSGVSMRRSSSVPCKRIAVERGSTSSSDDSGFSPGSPNNSAMIPGFNLEHNMRGMHINGENKDNSNNVPNDEKAQNKHELDDTSKVSVTPQK